MERIVNCSKPQEERCRKGMPCDVVGGNGVCRGRVVGGGCRVTPPNEDDFLYSSGSFPPPAKEEPKNEN